MIRVLVVDDDKLARKGLILAAPWNEFGMEVVGEASSGGKALEFLATHEVDLLLTDLVMPVMSGIELMRTVRQRHPRILFVVLTFHQDFEYVQEAIRLGAIDYIAKVQLEKERFEEVLGRIRDRFLQERRKALSGDSSTSDSESFAADVGYALLSVIDDPATGWIHDALEDQAHGPSEIGSGVWFLTARSGPSQEKQFAALSSAAAKREGWTALKLSGLLGEPKGRVYHVLRNYRQAGYYYEFDPDNRLITRSLQELDSTPGVVEEKDLATMKERWLSFDWIHDPGLFRRLMDEIRHARVPRARLSQILGSIESGWNRVYASLVSRRINVPESFSCWHEAEKWLLGVRETTLASTIRPAYARDIVDRVMNAVRIVNRELDGQLFAGDVAKRVGMSRSYFCSCFKDIVGASFNDHLRQVRLDMAKELLLHSGKPIYAIAEATGYSDEKYFSRVFRDSIGMLPSEYRLKANKGGRSSDG